jgi:hypothetical protein
MILVLNQANRARHSKQPKTEAGDVEGECRVHEKGETRENQLWLEPWLLCAFSGR